MKLLLPSVLLLFAIRTVVWLWISVSAVVVSCASLSAAEPPLSLVRIGGCSGVNVHPAGIVLSAKHCRHGRTVDIAFQSGFNATGRMAYESPGVDGVRAFILDRRDDAYPFSVVASNPPETQDQVYSWGYPKGTLAYATGEITGGVRRDGVPLNLATMAVSPGWSGGPLFNSQDEVLGLAIHFNPDDHSSAWTYWSETRKAYEEVAQQIESPQAYRRDDTTRVVVLSLEGCAPCKRLERDIAAGKFPGFTFEVATYSHRLGAWDKPELNNEFVRECNPPGDIGAPTIWVPGTGKYREGYDTTPGLLGWIEATVKLVFLGPPPRLPRGTVNPQSPAEPSQDATLLSEIGELREQLAALRHHVEVFQDGGVVTKIQGIAVLKEDKKKLENSISSIRERVDGIKEDPGKALATLLFGLFTGFLHSLLPWRKGS